MASYNSDTQAIRLRDNPMVGRMLIGGELVESAGSSWVESVNPATEDFIGRVPAATPAHVEAAVTAAEAAQPAWAALSVDERTDYLFRLGDAIMERADELLGIEVADTGNPITPMRGDILAGVKEMKYFASLGYELRGETIPATPGNIHFTIRQPYGVAARILAFNHPIYFAIAGIGAPLTAGNSLLLKSSEHSPLSSLRLGEIVREVLPPGVVNIISGGPEAGQAIVRHPRIKRISFVGSDRTGMAIQRAAADVCVKNISLELGGKNPFIVFPDAPVEQVAAAAVQTMNFAWQGQSCASTSRLFLHESIYETVLNEVAARVRNIRPGDPFSPQTKMGAVNSRMQLDKVKGYIDTAKAEGARVVAGGARPEGPDYQKGYWMSPTVLADVEQGMRIAREEVFGPVLSVIRWSDLDQVIAAANSVQYGLTGVVWTNNIHDAMATAKRLQAGNVYINGINTKFRAVPYGGFKNSGTGREGGIEELRSYTEEKGINIIG